MCGNYLTTEIARWGGVELYGFPKFIADIDFNRKKVWPVHSSTMASMF